MNIETLSGLDDLFNKTNLEALHNDAMNDDNFQLSARFDGATGEITSLTATGVAVDQDAVKFTQPEQVAGIDTAAPAANNDQFNVPGIA